MYSSDPELITESGLVRFKAMCQLWVAAPGDGHAPSQDGMDDGTVILFSLCCHGFLMG